MSGPAIRSPKPAAIDPRLLPAINRLLSAGMKLGRAGKHNAIDKVLQLVPEWTRGQCWQRMRQLRKTATVPPPPNSATCDPLKQPSQADLEPRPPSRRWTTEDDARLLNRAGYEPVDKIAQRLDRSVRAVRFRLCALGMSARVTDGWSLRALMKLLRVSPGRLRHFIGNGVLRVRDPRLTATSLAQFYRENATSLAPAALERVAAATTKSREAYPWERAADLLGVDLPQLQSWISTGHLKVMDTFVTDRSFEEFCRTHGSEINMALIDPGAAKWLMEEYGVPGPGSSVQLVPRAQKHALKVRTCKCGRKIAGNAYFKHAKVCKVVANGSLRQPV